MAGEGKRFLDYGFKMDKYLLPIDTNHTPMIERAVSTLNITSARFIFIIREENELNLKLRFLLTNLYPSCIILSVPKLTEGPASTAYVAKDYINHDEPLIISNSDQILEYDFDKFYSTCQKYDGCVLTYIPKYEIQLGAKDKHSFIKLENGLGVQIEEKKAISLDALVGTHYYKTGKHFIESYEYIVKHNIRAPNGEFYISNTYQAMINLGYKVGIHKLDIKECFYPVGEPGDYFDYYNKKCAVEKYTLNQVNNVLPSIVYFINLKSSETKKFSNCLIKVYSGQLDNNESLFTIGENLNVTAITDTLLFVVSNIIEPFRTIDINSYTRGWILGKFEPSLKQTDFEVCFMKHYQGQKWDYHYHKQSDEINVLISGEMMVNNIKIQPNDVFVFRKNVISCPIFVQDCEVICVKTVSVKGDKYII